MVLISRCTTVTITSLQNVSQRIEAHSATPTLKSCILDCKLSHMPSATRNWDKLAIVSSCWILDTIPKESSRLAWAARVSRRPQSDLMLMSIHSNAAEVFSCEQNMKSRGFGTSLQHQRAGILLPLSARSSLLLLRRFSTLRDSSSTALLGSS
jgi:hypothetical protein